ncbi:hypothetical protein CS063_01515 [Sporanaerobium hydrogeniformans]|uniref:Uncharacterized protein n=1 Tax=Sporanaerobium hydrogeniformans TaxID=3072179 RepID=A0AC61DFV3_9FIRM|nr:hypothetical protein [Sporanaerobium hydrogeniformans]PHV72180.1 hypothetical protein CS063_01515 [Sporanaerobium hydrogeniformans]
MVLDKVKGLLKLSQDEPLVTFTVGMVTDEVLNYCNLTSIPERLENVVAMMCFDVIKQSGLSLSEDKEDHVKSIREGDTTIQYVSTTEMIVERIKNPSFMFNYTAQLNTFRRLRR